MFKTEFGSEKYIEAISDCSYSIAMTKLRSSSHTLEVERGRYTKPKTNICERLCPVCNVIEDKIHFLANCKLYDAERTHFFGKVTAKIQNLHELNDADKFILLMSTKDKQILVWTGKFIYKCLLYPLQVLSKLLRRLVPCFVYLLFPKVHGQCRRWCQRRLSYNDSIGWHDDKCTRELLSPLWVIPKVLLIFK